MRDSRLELLVIFMYQSCNSYIIVGRFLTSSGSTKGSPRTYFRFMSSSLSGDMVKELSNSDLEHFSLHYMLLGYYHIAQLGNVNGLPTIILGARTLMCCWHNKGGIDCAACSPSWGTVFPHFLPAACWLELELASFCSRARCAFLIWCS